MDGRRNPAGFPRARLTPGDIADQLMRGSKAPIAGQGCGVGKVEIIGLGRAELQVQTGVVLEAQRARRQFHVALQYSCRRHIV